MGWVPKTQGKGASGRGLGGIQSVGCDVINGGGLGCTRAKRTQEGGEDLMNEM